MRTPLETTNRVGDPRYVGELNDARSRLTAWMEATDDDPARELSIEPARKKDWADGWRDPEQGATP